MESAATGQPILTDGVVTLRPWREDDVEAAVAGHDAEIAHWFGFPTERPTHDQQRAAVDRWHHGWRDRSLVAFAVEHDDDLVGTVEVRVLPENASGELSWALFAGHRRHGYAARAVRVLTDWALSDADQGGFGLGRVEAKVEPENTASLRVATRAGLRREGVRRVPLGTGDRPETTEYVVHARLATDPPLTEADGFRSLLNSMLPRKRAIAQLLVRDRDGRVLLCELTYKDDRDLPGGVVENAESPRLTAAREVEEELGLSIEPGRLLLTDWLPPWGGWDDALCLVFDGGVHDASLLDDVVRQTREIRSASFCTLEEVRAHAADFTARRVEAALASLAGAGGAFTESGRPV